MIVPFIIKSKTTLDFYEYQCMYVSVINLLTVLKIYYIFNGNSNRNGHVTSMFASATKMSGIRIRPSDYHDWISLRMEDWDVQVSFKMIIR